MRKYILTLCCVFITFPLCSQSAKTLFDSIPDSMLPLLTKVNRADFIDFKESNMKAEIKNRFDRTSEMTDLTGNYIRIRLTEHSTWEMKLLPVSDSTKVICVVSTVCAPVCDSQVTFYTPGWKALPAAASFNWPSIEEYLPDTIEAKAHDSFIEKADFYLAKAALSKEENTLTLTFTPEYFSPEDKELIEKISLKSLRYVWGKDEHTQEYAFIKPEKGQTK